MDSDHVLAPVAPNHESVSVTHTHTLTHTLTHTGRQKQSQSQSDEAGKRDLDLRAEKRFQSS